LKTPCMLTATLLILLAVVCVSNPHPTSAENIQPIAAKLPLTADGHMQISDQDRCPVCAMYPIKRPRSAAAMALTNGDVYYFCGNGCLLRTWLRPQTYIGQAADKIDRLVALDYFSGQPIDARKASWIAGSDVVGPMGPALIALGNRAHVSVFQKRHGGATVFALDELDDTLWQQISQRPLPPATTP